MNVNAPDKAERFFRIQHVLDRVPVSRNTIYRMMEKGQFPKNFHIGNTSFWNESEVLDWMANVRQVRHDEPPPKPKQVPRRKPAPQHMFDDILG